MRSITQIGNVSVLQGSAFAHLSELCPTLVCISKSKLPSCPPNQLFVLTCDFYELNLNFSAFRLKTVVRNNWMSPHNLSPFSAATINVLITHYNSTSWVYPFLSIVTTVQITTLFPRTNCRCNLS